MRGPSPLMSIHLVEAPGWLCTIYGTTKAKKASISTRMQPTMLVRFFRYLYIWPILAQLLDSACNTARVVANHWLKDRCQHISCRTDKQQYWLISFQLLHVMPWQRVHSNNIRLTKAQTDTDDDAFSAMRVADNQPLVTLRKPKQYQQQTHQAVSPCCRINTGTMM